MDEIIRLFKEVDGTTLFIAGLFVAAVIGIIADMIVKICKRNKL